MFHSKCLAAYVIHSAMLLGFRFAGMVSRVVACHEAAQCKCSHIGAEMCCRAEVVHAERGLLAQCYLHSTVTLVGVGPATCFPH